jgi:hypothetical protein
MANTRATATSGRTPCVPRLARFKISLPPYKFMKNHVEKTTADNWVSHSDPDYSAMAIMTGKHLADSTYDNVRTKYCRLSEEQLFSDPTGELFE